MLEDIKRERAERARDARLQAQEQEQAAAKDAATLLEAFPPYWEVLKQFCAESGWLLSGAQPTTAPGSVTASVIWDARGTRIEVTISWGPFTKAGWFTPSRPTFVTTATFVSCAAESEARGQTKWDGIATKQLVEYLRTTFLTLGPPPG